ncbi:MAG TPA: L-threonylcarbamoyladenylate synthase [Longimicrobiaceae bacterium]|nr:L-threonylcarbamoyladenylate synthase [Longimicrobiaceae bacterium]
MRVLKVDPTNPEPEAIAAAAAVLVAGGLVAMPTETVYGLGANALDPEAVERIFAAKGRPSFNPLIAHCATLEDARRLASNWPAAAETLGERFWPGPLTLVVPKAAEVPDRLTAGLPTVAIRVPEHPVALALLSAVDFPVAAPSANPFTGLSPTSAGHVVKGLTGKVDLLLDAGASALGIESTVVDLSGPRPVLLRPGALPIAALEEALGEPIAHSDGYEGAVSRPAPGMIGRHYSPRARLRIVSPADLREVAGVEAKGGAALGALLRSSPPLDGVEHVVTMPPDAPGYASRLYASLHELDDAGCDVILVEEPPHGLPWAAVRDRLTRASRSD